MNASDELRQRIADAIRAATCEGDCGSTEAECTTKRVQPIVWHYGALALVEGTPEQLADAVLPVVAAERAAAYRAAADELTAAANPHTERGAGVRWAADRLRARADQMGQQ